MRKLAVPFVLAVVLMGASPAPGIDLRLSAAGGAWDGQVLVCPPVVIESSAGQVDACRFTISSTGDVQPGSITVTMSAAGLTPEQVAARKFAVQPGDLVYLGPTPQLIATFSKLPAVVDPMVVWGALDNADLGTAIVVTYTVVATGQLTVSSTPPPTVVGTVAGAIQGGASSPLVALGLLLAACLIVGLRRRRSVP